MVILKIEVQIVRSSNLVGQCDNHAGVEKKQKHYKVETLNSYRNSLSD